MSNCVNSQSFQRVTEGGVKQEGDGLSIPSPLEDFLEDWKQTTINHHTGLIDSRKKIGG